MNDHVNTSRDNGREEKRQRLGNLTKATHLVQDTEAGVNSQDNLIFNQPASLVTLNPTMPSG